MVERRPMNRDSQPTVAKRIQCWQQHGPSTVGRSPSVSETVAVERTTTRDHRAVHPQREVRPVSAEERERTTIFDTVALLAAVSGIVLLLGTWG
jgi:hypothetical protein